MNSGGVPAPAAVARLSFPPAASPQLQLQRHTYTAAAAAAAPAASVARQQRHSAAEATAQLWQPPPSAAAAATERSPLAIPSHTGIHTGTRPHTLAPCTHTRTHTHTSFRDCGGRKVAPRRSRTIAPAITARAEKQQQQQPPQQPQQQPQPQQRQPRILRLPPYYHPLTYHNYDPYDDHYYYNDLLLPLPSLLLQRPLP